MPELTAQDIVRMLALTPHPEGGHFRETFRDSKQNPDGRRASTAAYYLLARGERSHWHRLDAAEIWHWYAGAPLQLEIAAAPGRIERLTLGGDISAGLRPQAVVPAEVWQAAQTTGEWTLVGCTVAPGFDFAKHEIAPRGWSPE
ncbi:MAG TPA: cupin domain-containing protein [Xanthobacteraceae bacterium]|nr:cupin domain-containing protein [Xanthobacteraceae bacterium]